MSFTTERPKSTAELIAELKESRQGRTANRKALLETYMADKMSKERQSVVESIQADIDANGEKQEALDSIRDRRKEERAVKESTLNRLTLLDSVKERTMTKVIFEMVYDALWIDDDVKAQTVQETYNAYKQTIAMVDTICEGCKVQESDKTPFLKGVESAVTEVCKKAVDRTIQEKKDCCDPDKEFEFTSEEEEELDKKLEELGRDEIVELVKKKVLAVVTDERKSGKEKAQMLKDLDDNDEEEDDDTKDDDSEDDDDDNKDEDVEEAWFGVSEGRCRAEEDCVKESVSAAAIAWTTAVLGVVIACEVIATKDKMDLKKALKIYESKMNPKIKLSQLTPVLYRLDSAHRPTDRELSGFSKLINKKSNRAKVWKDAKGNPICVAICYSATEITPGYQASLLGDSSGPTINVNVKYYYAYDVDPKYKKDGLYLAAMMAFEDGLATDNTRALVIDMKKAFPEEMKNTKVKMFGKTLESIEYDEDLEEGFNEFGSHPRFGEGRGMDNPEKGSSDKKKQIDAERLRELDRPLNYKGSSSSSSSGNKKPMPSLKELDRPLNYKGSTTEGTDYEYGEPVQEDAFAIGFGLAYGVTCAIILGAMVVCTKLTLDKRRDLKRALKIYESKESPIVKFSELTSKVYELDRLDTKSEKELKGLKKFFFKNARRAKVWSTTSGEQVCSSIIYSEDTRIKDPDGVETTLDNYTTTHKIYNVTQKYKKDSPYLSAAMCLSDGVSTKNTLSFTSAMEKAYPEEFKNTKAKMFGRTIESMEYDDDESLEEGFGGYEYVEPVEEGLRDIFKNIKTNMQHNKDVKDVSKYLNLFGKDCAGVFLEASKLDAKGENDAAVKKYTEYIRIIQQKQKDADKYIKEKGYDSAVAQVVKTGLTQEINLTKSHIEICKKRAKKKPTTESYKIALEAMIEQKQRRSLRNAVGGTLFESFMIANSNAIRDEAIMEGTDLDADASMNAALIETILQYTVLETLNTTKLYKFTSSDINKIKNHNRKSLRG